MTAYPLAGTHRFAKLGPALRTARRPTPLPAPCGEGQSLALAREMGFYPDGLQGDEALQTFTGHQQLPGTRPLASVYSAHQFGHGAAQLGDGRTLLLGDLVTVSGPQDIQRKGAGRTPYSRMGDGRAVLRSAIREFLCSDAGHARGIPTSQAPGITGSDAPVRREEIQTAAVVTRVAPGFIRFGHVGHVSCSGLPGELNAVDCPIFWRRLSRAVAGCDAAATRTIMLRRNPWVVGPAPPPGRSGDPARQGPVGPGAAAGRAAPPFDHRPGEEDLADFPPDRDARIEISCSS